MVQCVKRMRWTRDGQISSVEIAGLGLMLTFFFAAAIRQFVAHPWWLTVIVIVLMATIVATAWRLRKEMAGRRRTGP